MYSAEDLFTEDDVINDLDLVRENINDNEENEQQNENAEDEDNQNGADDNENNDEEKKVVKPKRVVRNPQPKLNVDTLKGKKGLLCLEGYFKDKTYKGRGYEQEDLRTIMKTYEYWCHRLYPKFPFDDCLSKIESLGTKKPLQTFLKRIRMDMICDEDKPILSDQENNEVDGNLQNNEADDDFDNNEFDELVRSVPTFVEDPEVVEGQVSEITEDQLQRMRLNKERADRVRQEKLQKQKEALSNAASNQSNENDLDNELLERIRLNKERAERLRQERLQKDKEESGNAAPESTLQTNLDSEATNVSFNVSDVNPNQVENELQQSNIENLNNSETEFQLPSNVMGINNSKHSSREREDNNDLISQISAVSEIVVSNSPMDCD